MSVVQADDGGRERAHAQREAEHAAIAGRVADEAAHQHDEHEVEVGQHYLEREVGALAPGPDVPHGECEDGHRRHAVGAPQHHRAHRKRRDARLGEREAEEPQRGRRDEAPEYPQRPLQPHPPDHEAGGERAEHAGRGSAYARHPPDLLHAVAQVDHVGLEHRHYADDAGVEEQDDGQARPQPLGPEEAGKVAQ